MREKRAAEGEGAQSQQRPHGKRGVRRWKARQKRRFRGGTDRGPGASAGDLERERPWKEGGQRKGNAKESGRGSADRTRSACVGTWSESGRACGTGARGCGASGAARPGTPPAASARGSWSASARARCDRAAPLLPALLRVPPSPGSTSAPAHPHPHAGTKTSFLLMPANPGKMHQTARVPARVPPP